MQCLQPRHTWLLDGHEMSRVLISLAVAVECLSEGMCKANALLYRKA